MSKKCQMMRLKSVPSGTKFNRLGMTAVELMLVVTILGILTTIAVSTYRAYTVSQYDAEAMATLNDLYAQSTQFLAEWGVGDNGITRGCFSFGCNTIGSTAGYSCAPAEGNNDTLKTTNITTNITLAPGVHHWFYQICFGFVDEVNQVEGFIVTARRPVDNGEIRAILFGTGIETPLVEPNGGSSNLAQLLPNGAQLKSVNWNNNGL